MLYVDDAHGFGVIGDAAAGRDHARTAPRGNSIVRHFGETYDDVVLVGGFSKAYSSLLAFLAVPTVLKNQLKVGRGALPVLRARRRPRRSPPSWPASTSTPTAATSCAPTCTACRRGCCSTSRGLGVFTPNTDDTPIIELPIALDRDLVEVSELLWRRGLFVTLAPYPGVPRDQVGFRVQVTAANTDEQIDELNAVISELPPPTCSSPPGRPARADQPRVSDAARHEDRAGGVVHDELCARVRPGLLNQLARCAPRTSSRAVFAAAVSASRTGSSDPENRASTSRWSRSHGARSA